MADKCRINLDDGPAAPNEFLLQHKKNWASIYRYSRYGALVTGGIVFLSYYLTWLKIVSPAVELPVTAASLVLLAIFLLCSFVCLIADARCNELDKRMSIPKRSPYSRELTLKWRCAFIIRSSGPNA